MRVYKFLSATHALEDLAEHRIKISEFSDMNDPFELQGVNFYSERADVRQEDIDAITQSIVDHFYGTVGALCLSRDWKNPVLWSHYADKHKGICLGFEVAAEIEIQEPNYVKCQERACVDPMFSEAATKRASGDLKSPAPKSQETFLRLLSTKFDAWRYEDEVRLLVRRDEKVGDFYFYPFDDKFKLTDVILGVRCPVPVAKLKRDLRDYPEPINITRAALSKTAFEMVVGSLDEPKPLDSLAQKLLKEVGKVPRPE